ELPVPGLTAEYVWPRPSRESFHNRAQRAGDRETFGSAQPGARPRGFANRPSAEPERCGEPDDAGTAPPVSGDGKSIQRVRSIGRHTAKLPLHRNVGAPDEVRRVGQPRGASLRIR